MPHLIAGWSSPVARQAHNLKVVGSNPAPATKENQGFERNLRAYCFISLPNHCRIEMKNIISRYSNLTTTVYEKLKNL